MDSSTEISGTLAPKELLTSLGDIPAVKQQLAFAGVAPSTALTYIAINNNGASFVIQTRVGKDAISLYPGPADFIAAVKQLKPLYDKTIYLLNVFIDSLPIPGSISKILFDTFHQRKCYTALHFRDVHQHSPSCVLPCFISTSVCHLGRVIDECAKLQHEAILIDTGDIPASLTYRKEIPQHVFLIGNRIDFIDLKFEDMDSMKNLQNKDLSQGNNLILSVWNAINASIYKKQITTKSRHNGYMKARTDNGTRAVTYTVENMKLPASTTDLKFTDCCHVRYLSTELSEQGRSLTLTMVPKYEIKDNEASPPCLEFIDGKSITKLVLHSYVYIPRIHEVSFPDLKELSFELTALEDVDFLLSSADMNTGILSLISKVEKLHIGINFVLTSDLKEKLKAIGDISAPNLKHLSMDVAMNDPGDLFMCNVWKCPNIETLHVNTETGYNYCLRLLEDFDNATSIKLTTTDGSKQSVKSFSPFKDRTLSDYVVFENLEELEIFSGMDMMLLAHPARVVFPKLKKLKFFGQYIYWRHQNVVFNDTTWKFTLSVKEMPVLEEIDMAITIGRNTMAKGSISTGSLDDLPMWDSCGGTLQVLIFSSAPKLKRLHITGDVCCLTLQGKNFTNLEIIDLTQDRESTALKVQLKQTPQALTMDCPIAYNFSARYAIPNIKILKYKTIRWPAVAHKGKSSRVWTPDTDIQAERYVRDLWNTWKSLYGGDEPDAKRAKTLEVNPDEEAGHGWLHNYNP